MTPNTFLTQSDFKRTVHHTDKLRVAAYIRVSTDSEDQENSFEVQKAYFEETLSKNNQWISAGVFADYGLSGTQKKKAVNSVVNENADPAEMVHELMTREKKARYADQF